MAAPAFRKCHEVCWSNLQAFVKPVSERFVKYINLRGYFMKWYLHIMKSILLTWLLCWFQHNKQNISTWPLVAHPNFIIESCLNNIFHLFALLFCERCRQLCVTFSPTGLKISKTCISYISWTCISTKYQTFNYSFEASHENISLFLNWHCSTTIFIQFTYWIACLCMRVSTVENITRFATNLNRSCSFTDESRH